MRYTTNLRKIQKEKEGLANYFKMHQKYALEGFEYTAKLIDELHSIG